MSTEKHQQTFNTELFANFSSGDVIDLQVISPLISSRGFSASVVVILRPNLIFGGLTEAAVSLWEPNLFYRFCSQIKDLPAKKLINLRLALTAKRLELFGENRG